MVRPRWAGRAAAHVRGDGHISARSTAGVLTVAALAGLGVALGCASEAGARGRAARIGEVQEGGASYYGKGFEGRRTASGERYDPNGMTAAHKSLPFGTRIRVTRRGGPS